MTARPADPEDDGREPSPWWAKTTTAATLTALCTILVAVAAFLAAQASSNSDDNYAAATLALTDANFFYEQATDALIEELAVAGIEVDRICMLALVAEPAEGQCEGTDELAELAADDPILEAGHEAQEAADEAFAVGLDESKRSVAFQASLVMFAVGLALSAWASLSDTSARIRPAFLVLAVLSLAAGLIRLVTV